MGFLYSIAIIPNQQRGLHFYETIFYMSAFIGDDIHWLPASGLTSNMLQIQ